MLDAQSTAQGAFIRPVEFGAGALVLLLAVYFGVVGLISGAAFALEEFRKFWYFILALALGFGIHQMLDLRRERRKREAAAREQAGPAKKD